MMSGTSHVSNRLSGSRSSAGIDSGAVTPSRAAVATTKTMSTIPSTFHIEYAHHPRLLVARPSTMSPSAVVATMMSPQPPSTAKSYGSLSPTVQDQEIDADEAREVKADQQPLVHGHHPGAQARQRDAQESGHEGEPQHDGLRRRWSERLDDSGRAHGYGDDQPHADGQRDRPGPISAVRRPRSLTRRAGNSVVVPKHEDLAGESVVSIPRRPQGDRRCKP